MNQEDIEQEIKKCLESPYYFVTKYLKIKHNGEEVSFTTSLTEEEFNKKYYYDIISGKISKMRIRR